MKVVRTPVPAQRGDRVEIREKGISPWCGMVAAVKWSSVSGWWLEVQREEDGVTWHVSFALTDVEVVKT